MTLRVPPKPPTPGDQPTKESAAECVPDDTVWLPFQQLDVYQVAREFVRLVHQAKITDAGLRDQATRAAKGAFLGLCEGLPLEGQGLRRKYFNEANGSLHETLGGPRSQAREAASARGACGSARRSDAQSGP